MGLFTLCVAGILVAIQATLILLCRPESAWAFNLARSAPDTETWRAALDLIVASGSNATAAAANNNNSGSILLTATQSDALVCLQAAVAGHSSGSDNNNNAYACLLQNRIPHTAEPVLGASWNPHLILLALASIHLLVCLGRVQARASATTTTTIFIPPSLAACILGLLLTACTVVHGLHDATLVQYPTLLSVAACIAVGCWYLDIGPSQWDWCLTFHLQCFGVPLSVLALAVFGPRLWAPVLVHLVMLSAAVNLLWLQMQPSVGSSPSWALRAFLLALVTLSLLTACLQLGPFDTWRYVVILACSLGLVPLYALSLVVVGPKDNDDAIATTTTSEGVRSRHHALSLIAGNGALLSAIVSFAGLF